MRSYSDTDPKYSFSQFELDQIEILKDYIPAIVQSEFEEYYLEWANTWRGVFSGNPYDYAKSKEYDNLLQYCKNYGKAVWPLLFDKVTLGRGIVRVEILNLYKDLTYTGTEDFFDGTRPPREEGDYFPADVYLNLVYYCKGLLEDEYENILKSLEIFTFVEKAKLGTNVIFANNQEIRLILNSEKDGKAFVTIYNILGVLEFEANYDISKGNQTFVINASYLKRGIYVVKVTIGGESISKTIKI